MRTRTPQKNGDMSSKYSAYTERPMARNEFYNEYYEGMSVTPVTTHSKRNLRSPNKSAKSVARPDLSYVSDKIRMKMDKIMDRMVNIKAMKTAFSHKGTNSNSKKSNGKKYQEMDKYSPVRCDKTAKSSRGQENGPNFNFKNSIENIRKISSNIRFLLEKVRDDSEVEVSRKGNLGMGNPQNLNLNFMNTAKSMDFSHRIASKTQTDRNQTEILEEDFARAKMLWPAKQGILTKNPSTFSQRGFQMNESKGDVPFSPIEGFTKIHSVSSKNINEMQNISLGTMNHPAFQFQGQFLNENEKIPASTTEGKIPYFDRNLYKYNQNYPNCPNGLYQTSDSNDRLSGLPTTIDKLTTEELARLKTQIDQRLNTRAENTTNILSTAHFVQANPSKGHFTGFAEEELKQSGESLAKLANLILPKEKFPMKSPLVKETSFQNPVDSSYEETDLSLIDIQNKLRNWDGA
jgi:hypothetical protein